MPRKPKEDPGTIFTKKICKEWVSNPLQNPLAKKKQILKVNETGVYATLKKNCKQLHNVEPQLSTQELEGNIVKKNTTKHTITVEQCKELQEDPHTNPITQRSIDPNALNSVYQRLVKECNELKAEIEKDAKPSDGDYRPSSEELLKLQKIRLRNALRAALQPIFHTTDSIENRIHFTKVLRRYTEMIKPCIESSVEKSNKLVLVKSFPKSRKVEEKIYFDARIGTESVYGMAYMNAGKGLGKLLRFSAKIMQDSFHEEIEHLTKMSFIAETGLSPNMPITYTTFHCKNVSISNENKLIKTRNVPPLLKTGKYYVVLNELANGDMHDFFKYKYSAAQYESVIMQMIFALRAFHKYTQYVHNDAHLGNFLYHKITPGGYWHYVSGKTDVFIPNEGYLVVLWDPGMARPINDKYQPYNPFIDYYRALRLVDSIESSKFYRDKQMLPVPANVFTPFRHLLSYISTYPSETIVMRYLMDRKDQYLSHIYFDKKKLPPNAKIINRIPYNLS